MTSLRGQTTRPFAVNYVLTFEPRSLPAAVDAGAPAVQFSWGIPNKDAVAAIRPWAEERWGPLDRENTVSYETSWRAYDVPRGVA